MKVLHMQIIFFSDTLDFKVNLSEENSYLNINKKFGIVVDNGTSIYASNIINSVNNVTNLVDDDGFYITNLDPMSFNRFPSQPSPERILDILTTKFGTDSIIRLFRMSEG